MKKDNVPAKNKYTNKKAEDSDYDGEDSSEDEDEDDEDEDEGANYITTHCLWKRSAIIFEIEQRTGVDERSC